MSLSSDGTVMTMPVQPANSGSGNGWGFGGDGAWWIIILFLFVFCGWGGNWGNNGFGGNGSTGAVDGYILTSDFANIERKIDNVNNGLCDGFYAQAQLVNGVQNAMQQGFMSAEISRANQQAAFMQQLNAMQMQQANCCCETREAIQGVNYQTKAGKAHGFNRGMIGRTLELLWEKFQNNFVYIHVFVTTWHLKYDIIDI